MCDVSLCRSKVAKKRLKFGQVASLCEKILIKLHYELANLRSLQFAKQLTFRLIYSSVNCSRLIRRVYVSRWCWFSYSENLDANCILFYRNIVEFTRIQCFHCKHYSILCICVYSRERGHVMIEISIRLPDRLITR